MPTFRIQIYRGGWFSRDDTVATDIYSLLERNILVASFKITKKHVTQLGVLELRYSIVVVFYIVIPLIFE
jgi:hypothetical protein